MAGRGRIRSRGAGRQAIQQAEEQASAADCPSGRMLVIGRVLTIRVDETQYGTVTKMLVKHDSGFKVWGTRPSGLNCDRGDIVSFKATVQQSDKDPKFGFYARPTNPAMIQQAAAPDTDENRLPR